jgi:O-antigen ligase
VRETFLRVLPPHRDGSLLLGVWVVWAATTALLHGRVLSPFSPYVVSPLVLAAGVALGRVVARRADRRLVDTLLLSLTAVLLVGVVATGGPAKGPLGYANANAALAVQVLALCGLAMVGAQIPRRLLLGVAGLGVVAVVALNASRAGLIVTLPLGCAIGVAVWRPDRRRRWALLAAAAALLAGAMGVVLLAGREDWPAWAVNGFDSTRQLLWHDALALWREHPVLGGGPGSFEATSPLAADVDTAAAHSSILQVGAETGAVGVVLLALLIATGLRYAARGAVPYALVAVAAWTALGLHSFVDHLVEYVPVVLAAGVVVGWASTTRSEELDVREGESPG